MNNIHVMKDLETWGLIPGSDIRSIGAVEFDPYTGEIGREFYVNIKTPWYLIKRWWWPFGKLTRDRSTMDWWSRQSKEAQQRLTTNQVSLDFGLHLFALWLKGLGDDVPLWSNGPHFDEAILAACYRAVGRKVPWSHRAPRDCRTIYEAGSWPDVRFIGVEHDALDDAKHQATKVVMAYRKIEGRLI